MTNITIVKDPVEVDLTVMNYYGMDDTEYTVKVAVSFDDIPDLDFWMDREDFFKAMDKALHLYPGREKVIRAKFTWERYGWTTERD